MQVDALAVRLRPRTMPEAVDLGVLLVHRHVRSIARVWAPVFVMVALVAMATVEIAGWLPMLVIFWAKPWLDRTLLFVLSRAVFGEETRWADLWAQRSMVWRRGLPHALTLGRLSPWRSYTQAIAQLEGQSGKPGRERRAQLLRGKRGAAFGMHFIFANAEIVLYVGLFSLALWFAPEGTHRHVLSWLGDDEAVSNDVVASLLYALAVFVVEPLYVAAGFLMYLNRRVELEAWDIEQEFRRAFA